MEKLYKWLLQWSAKNLTEETLIDAVQDAIILAAERPEMTPFGRAEMVINLEKITRELTELRDRLAAIDLPKPE